MVLCVIFVAKYLNKMIEMKNLVNIPQAQHQHPMDIEWGMYV